VDPKSIGCVCAEQGGSTWEFRFSKGKVGFPLGKWGFRGFFGFSVGKIAFSAGKNGFSEGKKTGFRAKKMRFLRFFACEDPTAHISGSQALNQRAGDGFIRYSGSF